MYNKDKICRFTFLSLFILFLSSCGSNEKQQPVRLTIEQVESKYASGVVLVQNIFYYGLTIGNGEMYFSDVDDDGMPVNLTFDESEIEPSVGYGTGFFISKDGMIATNSHVAAPEKDMASVRANLIAAMTEYSKTFNKRINEINEKMGALQIQINYADSYEEAYEYKNEYDSLEQERDELQEFVENVHLIGSMEYSVTLYNKIGVAYNGTHVTGTSDFHECVTIANDSENDLAIIQLKDRETPAGKHVFTIPKGNQATTSSEDNGSTPTNNLKVGTKIYLIAYNLGPTLALTNEGLKVQIASGEVSQNTDSQKILYTVPALHGSSGGPVISTTGSLVAINFAGIDTTQSFNFGIKVKYLRELVAKLKGD